MPETSDREGPRPEENEPDVKHVRPPHVGPAEGTSPYDALAPFGAQYDSTMSEIHRAGMAAQKAKQLDSTRRRAWKDLRNVKKRIQADAAWLELPETEAGDSVPPPPTVELPEVPAPSPDELLAQMEKVPVPEVPPYRLQKRPPIPLDHWELAEELVNDFYAEKPYEDEVPSFLEDTV